MRRTRANNKTIAKDGHPRYSALATLARVLVTDAPLGLLSAWICTVGRIATEVLYATAWEPTVMEKCPLLCAAMLCQHP